LIGVEWFTECYQSMRAWQKYHARIWICILGDGSVDVGRTVTSGFDMSLNLQVKFEVSWFGACVTVVDCLR
jgi:hypothetical protein